MLRYRMYQKKQNQLSKTASQLAKIDRNAKIGIMFNKIINWISNVRNKFLRLLIELLTGIDKRVILPRYNSVHLTDVVLQVSQGAFLFTDICIENNLVNTIKLLMVLIL